MRRRARAGAGDPLRGARQATPWTLLDSNGLYWTLLHSIEHSSRRYWLWGGAQPAGEETEVLVL
eukprot:3431489-Pyramimonas_sp.AAC.1